MPLSKLWVVALHPSFPPDSPSNGSGEGGNTSHSYYSLRVLFLLFCCSLRSRYGLNGLLGVDDSFETNTPVQLNTSALGSEGVAMVSVGVHHALLLGTNGTVAAWGFNGEGQLGFSGTPETPRTLVVVAGQQTTRLGLLLVLGAELLGFLWVSCLPLALPFC